MTSSRKPRSFDPGDATVEEAEPEIFDQDLDDDSASRAAGDAGQATFEAPTLADLRTGFRWSALFFAAAAALSGLAISLWFARLVSVALARDDWIGWVSLGLLGAMCLATVVIALREITGLLRLRAMTALRAQSDEALRQGNAKMARRVVADTRRSLRRRRDMKWALGRHKDVYSSAHDARETLTLADRELVAPLDAEARKVIAQSAKRVSVVTALSPAALIDVLFVLAENVRMLRRLATLYGGRPGVSGGLSFGRQVVGHLIATGGLALTDDLLGQFIGQDLIRRLSRRMGEGLFNGALTARIGVAAIDLVRPLPHIESAPPKFREIVKEIAFRRAKTSAEDTTAKV